MANPAANVETQTASSAAQKRPRIVSTWLVLTLAAVVLATMYAVAPRGGMRERIASVGAPSDLSVAYLEAWSRVQPDNEEFLSLLGAQYLYLGRADDAQRVAARMDALHTDDMRRAATMLRLGVAEQRTFALVETDPRRAAALDDLRAKLTAAANEQWAPHDLEWLAQRAAAAGLPRVALDLYARLSAHDPKGRHEWDTQITRYALQVGDYHAAADAWFRKQATAQTRDEARRCFIAGIRTLQSGNLLDDALAAADAHLGTLDDDPATLIVLLNLARAANRPEAVDRYARMLARYAQAQPAEPEGPHSPRSPAALAYAQAHGDLAAAMAIVAKMHARTRVNAASASYAYLDGPVARRAAGASYAAPNAMHDGVYLIRVAASTQPVAAPEQPVVPATASTSAASTSAAVPAGASAPVANGNIADVVYNAFVESGDLASAEKIAAQQVQRDPHSVLWVKRLAQTAEWNRDAPRALKSWLDYAQLSDDPVGWQNVLRIAPMLDDDEAYLTALVHQARQTPNDLKLIDNVTATYERLGRPDDGLAFLRSLPRGVNGDALDQRIGALAERAGHDDQALAAYRAVQARHPNDANAALRTASVLYRAGDYRASFAALKRARAGASDKDEDFWRDYAELARLLQLDSEANDAYQHLLASGVATPEELGEMTYFYDPYPIDAGRVAELRYRRDHTPRALQDAIFYYTDAQAYDRVATLLASLTPDELRAAEASPGVLAVRAEYERLTDRPLDALADLKRAVELPDATSDMRAAYLWTLVDYGSDADLKLALNRWRGNIDRSAALWEPYAAAEMRLNRPVAALEYLRRQAGALSRDPLWLLTYADAQEMAGHADLAWSIRHKVWLQLQQDAAALAKLHGAPRGALRGRTAQDAETLADVRGRRVALSTDYTTADASAALLDNLLSTQAAPPDVSYVRRTLLGSASGLPGGAPEAGAKLPQNSRLRDAVAKEVAIAWALSHESNPLAKRWLAQQYAARLARPADAQLTIALADNDIPALERLLSQERSRLPIADRIDATIAVDQRRRAQQIAFEGLEGAPEDTALHTRVTETALDWPQSIDATVTSHVEHPLDYIEQTLAASHKIAERYMVGVLGVQNFQHSTDITQLVDVPSVDRSLSIYGERQTRDTSFKVTAGRRDALASFYTFALAAETGRNSPLTLGLRAGRNQLADETQSLQVGAMKDNLVGDFTYRVTERITITGSVEADRFYSQARSYIGSGVLSNGEISYRFHTEYPDYTLRVVGTHGGYGASGSADPLISRLIPAADQPAVASDFLPDTYTQYGLYFGFGNDLLEQYTHRWRPFLDVGILHDSNQGWGPDFNVGLAGTVFGGDHMALFIQHQRVSRLGTPVTLMGARYSWYY
ncbi:tetratricopeptide repeat protein [Paraburkholderia sp. SARCC-3016]|uniref:tetratricopeptide repeat protein n=1 Tax=Paraburkholderia sp. SARCC-3016 TaxID=3058611 RepID=UPI002808982A|nr:tetratricopeptide repeat protein [Paraburkholderia sp. SARCC-3016]MDQ7977802.1 tetratricopeptide repeat protein [Paraburkholderia sp. SARCC-3016]